MNYKVGDRVEYEYWYGHSPGGAGIIRVGFGHRVHNLSNQCLIEIIKGDGWDYCNWGRELEAAGYQLGRDKKFLWLRESDITKKISGSNQRIPRVYKEEI